ncbi:hypothetical protein SAPIO_CDS4678 [Scedosporium apiospermum]|uniref:Uncharacterized protein n=1 Tax=Pseudallescheria apiosperma TaxID=563466 RepID=A0A084G816_PSEDA|nr:uncharacterized protein SAPIO_CDS4678 [Scedosporium apiospermum]KEZ43478.1 hypothetical protein SAPIO_CDS4678 [Scedosporium apiospermum]
MSSPEPPQSAARVLAIPELLSNIGGQITNKKALYNLCLTSKAFNQAFSPFLYAAVRVVEPKWDTRFATGRRTAWFGSIRSLCIVAPYSGGTVLEVSIANDTARSVFQVAHGLEQFRTISALFENCRKLSAVSITFAHHTGSPDSEVDVHGADVELSTGLSNLENLKQLTLEELYGDIYTWRHQIVDVLCQSPELEHLALSLSDPALERAYWDEQARGVETSLWKYFDELCVAYHEKAQSPLRLKSLQCGTAVLPFEACALRALTDLNTLEAVYIHNMDVICDEQDIVVLYRYGHESGIAWEGFSPNSAPNLRRFSVYQCEYDVRDFLLREWSELGSQLALSFSADRYPDPDDGGILREADEGETLRQLWKISPRMYDLELEYRSSDPEAAITPAEKILADAKGEYIAAEPMLEIVVAYGRDTLEGLTVRVEWRGYLNRENSEPLQHWTPLLGAIRRLNRLTQLDVGTGGVSGMSAEEERDVLKRAPEELATAGPALCYVGIDGRYWRVFRRDGEVADLEELDDAEARHVEIFRHALYPEMKADFY